MSPRWAGGKTSKLSLLKHDIIAKLMKRENAEIEPDPVIEAYKKDVDVTLIRENLKLSVEERLRKLMRMQRFVEELRRATKEASNDRLREPAGPAGSNRG